MTRLHEKSMNVRMLEAKPTAVTGSMLVRKLASCPALGPVAHQGRRNGNAERIGFQPRIDDSRLEMPEYFLDTLLYAFYLRHNRIQE